jgi:hypothetical protein
LLEPFSFPHCLVGVALQVALLSGGSPEPNHGFGTDGVGYRRFDDPHERQAPFLRPGVGLYHETAGRPWEDERCQTEVCCWMPWLRRTMWRKLAGGFAAYVKGYLRTNHVCSSVPSSDLTWLGIILASAATLRYRVHISSSPTNIPCVSRVSCCRGVVACLNLAVQIRDTCFPL